MIGVLQDLGGGIGTKKYIEKREYKAGSKLLGGAADDETRERISAMWNREHKVVVSTPRI